MPLRPTVKGIREPLDAQRGMMHHVDVQGQGSERCRTGVSFRQREFAEIDPGEARVPHQSHQSRLLVGMILEAFATFAGHTR